MHLKIWGYIFILILVIGGLIGMAKITGNMTGKAISSGTQVKLETNYGNIVIQLYEQEAPITVANFKKYVNEGFYDGTTFHRIIPGFMVQGGGFTTDGQQKQTHEAIKLESKNGLKNDKGTIAMARTNVPDSATSQFFINVADNNFLNYGVRDEGYAVFGKVVHGMDVIDKIASVETDSSDRPLQEVKILRATVLK
jgi:peptidyl-prolyl cis-trans isomerase A (cyclophilin A)